MGPSKVYFTDMRALPGTNLQQKLKRLILKAGIGQIDFQDKYAAIKIHFGEPGNLSYLRPNFAKTVADAVKELGGRPAFHINIVNQVSPYCDCHGENDTAIIPDVGMFASFDPVALDVACADACNRMPVMPGSLLDENLRACGARDHHDHFTNVSPNTDWRSCMEHGEKIGLGTRSYELITVK